MGANENHAHESFIKTPKQLVVVVVLAFVVPIVLIVLLTQLVTSGRVYDKNSPAMSDAEIAKRIRPVADASLGEPGPAASAPAAQPAMQHAAQMPMQGSAPAAAPAAKADGRKVYESTCITCHGTGVANAPKFGDKKAWAPHLMHGVEHLQENALKGIRAMPPRGGNLTLSDAEVKAAVDYMVGAVR